MGVLKEIAAIGFDLDNTLYYQTDDISQAIKDDVCVKVAKRLNQGVQETRERFFLLYNELGSANRSLVKMGIPDKETALAIVNRAVSDAGIEDHLSIDTAQVSIMQRLREKYKLFLVTNSFEDSALRKLNALGIDPGLFSVSLFGESSYSREDGSAFEYVSKKLGIAHHEMVFVGDRSKVDIEPASELGIRTVIIHGSSKYADYEIGEFKELEEIFL